MNDLFETLGNLFRPFENMQRDLELSIQRRIMNELIICRTADEVDKIVLDNIEYFDRWPQLICSATRAKNRIETKIRYGNWELTDMN